MNPLQANPPSNLTGEPLLVTKLYRPEPRPHLVERRRLLDLLDRSLAERRRLTLVSAPAGYGKTTLVSAWLHGLAQAGGEQEGWAAVWLALDENDNDPVRFFLYLVGALRGVCPGIGAATLDLAASPHAGEAAAIVTPLINELAATGCRVLLVLDDYHAIRAPLIHAALDFLCRHAPPTLHIVLLTRADPPLPLATWRARGLLTELRTHDLRFTGEEVRAFFAAVLPNSLPPDAGDALAIRTEGWAAGLQLAALSLDGCDADEVAAFVAAFHGSDRYIMDYLVEQVLQRLPDDLRGFLCQVAVLERMCAPLCAALTGRQDSAALLGEIDRANLFLVRLDRRGEWFRFHHLFAELLRLELEPETEAAMHRRAAGWLASSGDLPAAIHHALAAGDAGWAAELIRQAAPGLLRTSELRTLLHWIDRLPPALVQGDIDLAAYKTLALFFSGEVAQAAAYLHRLGADDMLTAGAPAGAIDAGAIDAAPSAAHSRLYALRAWMAELHGEPSVEQWAQAALALAPLDDPFARMIALLPLGHVQRARGESRAALHTFEAAASAGQQMGHSFAAIAGMIDLAFSLLDQGARRQAEALCEAGLGRYVDGQGRPLPVACLLDIPLTAVYYHANELDAAWRCAVRGLEAAQQVLSAHILGGDGQRFLALIQFARGQTDAALETLQTALSGAEQVHHRRSARMLAATQAHLHLRLDDLPAVQRWATAQDFRPDRKPAAVREYEYCIYAHWLRAEGRAAESLQAFTGVAEQAAASGRVGRLIGVHIGQALAEQALRRQARAAEALAAAVALAAPEDFRSQFLDAGAPLLPLLRDVRGAAPVFVDDLLRRAGVSEQAAQQDHASQPPAPQPLAEPLSARELEVLALLAAGRSYREIAQELIVAIGTVQAHCGNIYGKLGVGNRTQAVLRARELKLIP